MHQTRPVRSATPIDVPFRGIFRFVLLLVIPLCLCASAVRIACAADKPNIIFLLADDQRLDTMKTYGNPVMHTPHLDRLASEGVVFDNCFVTTSICATNRACIYTGQYASRNGIWSFRKPLTDEQLANGYAGVLKKHGYHIGFIGKWGVAAPPKNLYDYNKGWPGQNKFFHTVDGKPRHLTEMMGEQAIEYLDIATKQDKPFCLAFSFKAPHVYDPDKHFMFQYDPALKDLYKDVAVPAPKMSDPAFFNALPEIFFDCENRRRWHQRFSTPEKYQKNVKDYWRLISGIDVQVGRIREHLKKLGVADNTIIIYSSDHGFYLGERGFAGKWYAHERSIRVPLLVLDPRQPKEQRSGSWRAAIAMSIDIPSTIMTYAGASVPKGVQGVPLQPVIAGQTPSDWRTEFFYEHNLGIRTIPQSEGVRTPRWKYMVFHQADPPYEELYDMQVDPDEAHNLAYDPAFAKKLEEMRAKHAAWKQKVQ